MKKTIGLLGGIGPESTGYFYLKLINQFVRTYNPKQNTEYPHILINSIPAPELTLQEGTKEVLAPYIQGLKVLENAGVDVIGIICNTAYVYFDALQKEISVPIINIRSEVEKKLKDLNIQSITALATPYTLASGLYHFEGFKNIGIDADDVKKLAKAISNYNLGLNKEDQKRIVHSLINTYAKQSDIIILGCSEVALMAEGVHVITINPMDMLIEVLLEKVSFLKKDQSMIDGFGIFTTQNISQGEIAYTVPLENIVSVPTPKFARVGDGKYVGDEMVLNWVNHSCSPNVLLDISGPQPALVALRDIEAEEEILCDYNQTEVGGVKVPCNCKSKNCRGCFLRVEQ